MRFACRRSIGRLIYRRAASATLLAAYAVTAIGVPLPSGGLPQKSGELYPCANCGCGCASAEQCWRSCCCHTLAERMAWAHEHHVRPPKFAIAMARQAGLDLAWLKNAAAPGSAGRLSGVRVDVSCSIKETPTEPGAAGRVGVGHACCHCCVERHAKQPNVKATSHVIAWQALQCQGKSSNWLAAVPTMVAPRGGLSDDAPILSWLCSTVSKRAGQDAASPAVPPPERA